MPATEQTWYSQKLLHVVFGLTSLLLLLSTLWMFAADEKREWKGYQSEFRDVEQRLTKWRIAEVESATYEQRLDELNAKLLAARTESPDAGLYSAFKSELAAEHADEAPDFAELDAVFADLEATSGEIAESSRQVAELAAAEATVAEGLAADGAALAALESPDQATRKAAEQAVDDAEDELASARKKTNSAKDVVESLAKSMAKTRDSQFLSPLRGYLKAAKDDEIELSRQVKFASANSDAAKAQLGLAVRDGKPQTELDAIQGRINEINDGEGGLKELTLTRQAATAHRKRLQNILAKVQVDEAQVSAEVGELTAEADRLADSYVEREVEYFTSRPPFLGKKWLELPILNAFNSPHKIDNLWTENLTLANGSFGQVRRFDRCTTCHKGIDKTAAGTADKPAYMEEQAVELVLQTPDSQPVEESNDGTRPGLLEIYGFQVAGRGLIENDDAAVNQVVPQSLAAKAEVGESQDPHMSAGLLVGDVIEYVGNDKVLDPTDVNQFLIDGVEWGEPVTLKIRRGLPHPYASHPRLDLFVGSLSPHNLATFGCTSCHEGQGSATSFGFASHTPNTPAEGEEWAEKLGWFNNHHWIYPMYPERFAESVCLKCHHDVTELEPSSRFAEAPAPKVVEGHELIQSYGCFGCHEINGYNGPDKRVGPDMRLEPNYFAAAGAVKADPGFAELEESTQRLAETLVASPEDNAVRHRLQQALKDDAAAENPKLTSYSHKMASVLDNTESPGKYRKVGPSLRFVGKKLDPAFMYDWIREPKNFRPSTKMPQFFGLWDHLHGGGLETAKKMERVEILSTVVYLLNRSKEQPFDYLKPADGCEPGSAERGKEAFEVRGCLACHQHGDFPHVTSSQGPNLTGLGDKFASAPATKQWLYTWVKQPTHYHARTKMPDLYLDPIETEDGKLTDPVADIVEYLLSSSNGWKPSDESMEGLTVDPAVLDELVLEFLSAAFPQRDAEEYLKSGIPEDVAATLKGAEVALTGSASQENKLMYIGEKTISRYGCYACHDIPGFEDAKPIGAALAEWGRKESSKLAFEHILEYLDGGGHGGHGAHGGDQSHDGHVAHTGHAEHGEPSHEDDREHVSPEEHPDDSHDEGFDESYYAEQLAHGDRSGFIWQKLKEPRSYDYHKVENKKYTDRLRMPLFPFGPERREAVVTFVLGLVAEPPADEFVYQGDPRSKAITEGLAVIQKYNCAGCHVLEAEKWDLQFEPDELDGQPEVADFDYVLAHASASQLAASADPDSRLGVLSAQVHGMPSVDKDGVQIILDEEGDPIEEDEEYDPSSLIYSFDLWEPTVIDGQMFQVGVKPIELPAVSIVQKHPTVGGDLAKWLLPKVIEIEKEVNPAADGTTAWGWLPPPLIGEGRKVQPDWLHSFLLDPYEIRPSVFLRMPKFNMSSEEATKLVNYFAAKDDVDFPFEYSSITRPTHLAAEQEAFEEKAEGKNRLDQAMNIVTSTQYCVQCHLIGDFMPAGSPRALAPDLDMVQHRLRPEYLRDWIANPKRILPYTSMPVNIVYDPNSESLGGVEQSLFAGTSVEQVDALVDLLMNYGDYSVQKNSVANKVKQAAPAASPDAKQEEKKEKAEAAVNQNRRPQRLGQRGAGRN